MVDVVVQIVNYQTKEYLVECIRGFLADCVQSHVSCSICVLDNASGDDLTDVRATFSHDPVEFFFSEVNGGFGAGHNFLSRQKESRYLLVANPDVTIIEPQSVARLLENLRDSSIAATGPRLCNAVGTQPWDHGECEGARAQCALACGLNVWKPRNSPADVAWVSGAFFLMRRDLFDLIGGFDEKFFLYKEEEDLFLRIRQAGYRVLYDPRVTVFHVGSVVASKKVFMKESEKYFFKKYFASRGFFRYVVAYCARALARIFLWYT
jgi:hypothetical protein